MKWLTWCQWNCEDITDVWFHKIPAKPDLPKARLGPISRPNRQKYTLIHTRTSEWYPGIGYARIWSVILDVIIKLIKSPHVSLRKTASIRGSIIYHWHFRPPQKPFKESLSAVEPYDMRDIKWFCWRCVHGDWISKLYPIKVTLYLGYQKVLVSTFGNPKGIRAYKNPEQLNQCKRQLLYLFITLVIGHGHIP